MKKKETPLESFNRMKRESEVNKISSNPLLSDENFADSEEYSICPDCKCCEMAWEECWKCGGSCGDDGEELMMEDPLWYDKDDFRECDVCDGKGGWEMCIGRCDENGKHKH